MTAPQPSPSNYERFYDADGKAYDLPTGVGEQLRQNPLMAGKFSAQPPTRDPLNTSGAMNGIQRADGPVSVSPAWGRQASAYQSLDLPSGSRVKIRKLELVDLIALGLMDLLDSFSQQVFAEDSEGKTTQEIGSEILKGDDVAKIGKVIEMTAKISAAAVVEPKVHLLSEGEEMDPDKVYAHLIPFEDQMTIFEAVIPSMEGTFRDGEGSPVPLADVENGEGLQHPAV